jgi:hypothetical protein
MRDGFTGHIMGCLAAPRTGLVKCLAPDEEGLKLVLGHWPEIQPRIASRLLSESGVPQHAKLGELLSRRAIARLDRIERAADEPAYFFRRSGMDEG